MSEASVINESCQDTVPAAGYMYSPVSTYSALTTILGRWAQFNFSDLTDAEDDSNITILNTSVFDSAIAQIKFTINGKEGLTYLWARHYGLTANGSSAQSDYGHSGGKAVLICPGSGLNETNDMMNSTGYDNVLFPIGCAAGDAFVLQYPGQDLHAIVGTNSPTAKKYISGAIENYLVTKGTSCSIISLIDICVAMKWLRTAHSVNSNWPSYTNIGIMGLSKGGFFSAMGALYTSPTAVISASGFSLKTYRSIGFGGGWNIPDAEVRWDQTTLVNAIKASTAAWYYTVSDTGNELAMMKEEASDSETATACAGANFTYNMHHSGHVYPSGTLTWLQGVL